MRQKYRAPHRAGAPYCRRGTHLPFNARMLFPAAITGLIPALDRRLGCNALVGAGLRCGTSCRARLYVGHGGGVGSDVAFRLTRREQAEIASLDRTAMGVRE